MYDDRPVAAAPHLGEAVPKHAPLSAASFTQYSKSDVPSVLDAGNVRYVSRGSMAIGLALRHAKVVNGDDEVLLPAYHCISMIEPVVAHGARPVFYRINADLSVDLKDVERRLTARTRALLVTHYFGFPQNLVRLRSFCDAHGIMLIEDCAHAFFGATNEVPVGSLGDYAVASAWKFFPICDGGVLVSRNRNLADLDLESGGAWFQAKALVNMLEQSFEYGRLSIAHLLLKVPFRVKDLVLRRARRNKPSTLLPAPALSNRLGGWGFDAALIGRRMSIASRLVVGMASKNRIANGRRRNFATLLDALGEVRGVRPLFRSLPAGVVPQVFPLVFDDPERAFPLLRQAGVPIIRFGEYLWEGMDPSTCAVSAELSRRVFQFPCHQELKEAELTWMIDQVKSVCPR